MHGLVGYVNETLPHWPSSRRISLLRIDVDIYSATYDTLHYLYPRLSPGGAPIDSKVDSDNDSNDATRPQQTSSGTPPTDALAQVMQLLTTLITHSRTVSAPPTAADTHPG